MSELKPPSQNSPGPPPARARTAMRRASWPTSMKSGSGSGFSAAGWVMNPYTPCNVRVIRRLFDGALDLRQWSTGCQLMAPATLAEGSLALYVGSSEHFALVSVIRRDQNVSHL